jgi:hypothetical protein
MAGIAVFMTLVVFLVSCGSKPAPESAGGAAAKGPAASTTQAPVAPPAGGTGGWLEGIPEVMPHFTYGTFDSKQSSKVDFGDQTMYNLYYNGVTPENVREYLGKLRASGFRAEEENANPGDISAAGDLHQGPGKIGFSLHFEAKGHVDLGITVVKKS